MSNSISFNQVSKSYEDKTVLRDINFDIEQGDFVTIVGSSGSGKTTMMKMINSLITPSEGTIFVKGEDIAKVDPIRLRRQIGYCIQGSLLFPHLTVADNISYVPNLTSRQSHKAKADLAAKWLKIVGLSEDLADRYPDELSGGQQQRVGIARALAGEADIILMDEPFGAVDEITREQLQTEIKQVHEKNQATIIFITHDIEEALYLGNKVLVLDQGVIQQYGSPKELLEKPATPFVEKLLGNRLSKTKKM